MRVLQAIVIASALAAGPAEIGPPARADEIVDTMKVEDAIKTLENSRAVVSHRFLQTTLLYDYDYAVETLVRAMNSAGVTSQTINSVAGDWAKLGLRSWYLDLKKDVYIQPMDALESSGSRLKYLRPGYTVRASSIQAIKNGFERWMIYERGVAAMMTERVDLYVRQGVAEDFKTAAGNMVCADNDACEAARNAAYQAAVAEEARIEALLSANLDELRKATAHFIDPLREADEVRPRCTRMNLTYAPSTIGVAKTTHEFAVPIVTFEPEFCAEPKVTFHPAVTQDLFDLERSGIVTLLRNERGSFKVAAVSFDLMAYAEITARPDFECKEVDWSPTTPDTVHDRTFEKVALTFRPISCARPSEAEIHVSDPSVLWVEGGTTLSRRVYGRKAGEVILGAQAGRLRAPTRKVKVKADGPDCTSMSVSHAPATARAGRVYSPAGSSGLAAEIGYLPAGCRIPDGELAFETITPGTARVTDSRTGAVELIRAGKARIGVRLADLSAIASIGVTERPACDSAALIYTPDILDVGQEVDGALSFRAREGNNDAIEDNNCILPQAAPRFSSSDDLILHVDPGTGRIRALAPGSVIVQMEVEGVSTSAEIDIRSE